MALKTVNPFAVLYDLAGTALAVSENLSLWRQPACRYASDRRSTRCQNPQTAGAPCLHL